MLKSNATKAAGGNAAERTYEICLYIANVSSVCVIVTGSSRKKKKKKTHQKNPPEIRVYIRKNVEKIHALSPDIFGAWHDVPQLVEKMTLAF